MFARVTSRRHSPERRAARVLNEYPLQFANEELQILMSSVQELIDRLGTAADPELKRLRKQAEAALARTQAAIDESGRQLRDQARQLAEHGQEYVRRRPLGSVGILALGMLAIGLLTGRAMAPE